MFVNASRVMMAMGIDGTPAAASSPTSHPRTHTPDEGADALELRSRSLVAAVFAYKPTGRRPILIGGAITSVLVVGVTCLGRRAVPVPLDADLRWLPLWRRTRSRGVPLITIAGIVGALCVGVLIVCALTVPALALTAPDRGSRSGRRS